MFPTLWSLALAARGIPPLRLLAIFVAGSFVMRSAGVVMNDFADRSFDRHVARTRVRPLASGELSATHALLICGFFLLLAGTLVLFLDPLTILLSPIAVLLAGLYPLAKRVIHIPQAMLGIAFGWGTIMAWTASRGDIEAPAWCLFAATICWAIGYDTIYALQDREDDRRIGVKSSALLFGSSTWIAVGAVFLRHAAIAGTRRLVCPDRLDLLCRARRHRCVVSETGSTTQTGGTSPYRPPHVSATCVGRRGCLYRNDCGISAVTAGCRNSLSRLSG